MNYSIFNDTIADMTWTELEEKSNRNIPVLFPLGVIEEHGPHLPLGTDIYFSSAVCRKIKAEILALGGDCLIAPPYYFGINHCTGGFPGSFSLKPETMKLVLGEIFENLKNFGFNRIYCINEHGDAIHIGAILDAVKAANKNLGMSVRMLIEPFELRDYGLTGEEEELLLDLADYPPELFAGDNGLLDIHAGAFETAAINLFYGDMANTSLAETLPDYSLSYETIGEWLKGGDDTKKAVPMGYAGNPAAYKDKADMTEALFNILCKYLAKEILNG